MAAHKLAVEYRLAPDEHWRTLPPSQAATLLLYLYGNKGSRIIWDDMYRALGSHEVDRTIATLRKKHQVPVLCDREPKVRDKGYIGLYRIGEGVEVRRLLDGRDASL